MKRTTYKLTVHLSDDSTVIYRIVSTSELDLQYITQLIQTGKAKMFTAIRESY